MTAASSASSPPAPFTLPGTGSPPSAPSPLLLAERAARGEAIPWSDALSIGIPSIDAQHRVLLAYLNQLSSAIARGQDAAVLAEVIAGLEGYTRLHFRHEERLFALHGWEEEAGHVHGHRHFEQQLAAFRERLATGDAALARDVLRFLIAWLAEHILEDDLAYSAHLRACGVR